MEKENNQNNVEINSVDKKKENISSKISGDLKKQIESICQNKGVAVSEYVNNCLLASVSKDNDNDLDDIKDIDFSSEVGRVESYIESISNIFNSLENTANAKCEKIRKNYEDSNSSFLKLNSNLSDTIDTLNQKIEELDSANLLLNSSNKALEEEKTALTKEIETKDQLLASFKLNEQTVADLKLEVAELKQENIKYLTDRDKLIESGAVINQLNQKIEELESKNEEMGEEHDQLIKLQTENEILKKSKIDLENRLNKPNVEKKA